MPISRKSPRAAAILFGLMWLVASCTPPQPLPLYTPLHATRTYGYSEEQLSDSRYRVSYDAPIETRYRAGRADRRREVDRKVSLAYDMALLRAAELAHRQGFQTFRISDRENNVRIEERDEYRGSPFLHPYWHGHHRFAVPYYAVPYYAYPDFVDRITEVAVSVAFVAEFGGRPDENTFDARMVIDRLSQQYSIGRPPAA